MADIVTETDIVTQADIVTNGAIVTHEARGAAPESTSDPEAAEDLETTSDLETTEDLEATLVRLWSAKLGVPEVGVHDDFFELGGDSLLAADLLMDIYRETGLEVDAAVLFLRPTIADLIEAVRAEAGY